MSAAAPTNYWKLGLFVTSGLVASVLILAWLGVRAGRKDTFDVVTYFDESVQGLDTGAPVKIRGARVGTVSKIEIAPDRRRVEVVMELDRDLIRRIGITPPTAEYTNIRKDLRVQLSQVGIAGTVFVLADIVDPAHYPEPELSFTPPPNYVPSMPSFTKDLTQQLRTALEQIPEISQNAHDLMARIRLAIDDADIAGISSRAKGVLETANAVLEPLPPLAERLAKEGGIDTAAAQLPETLAAIRETAATIRQVAADLDALSESADASLEALRETLVSLKAAADKLEHDPGAILRGRSREEKGGAP